ncbi:MAG: Gfo/Idh/MocA family oxidoreductase [Kiritimatiellae bacterium]|nr:Gfo/Idh/MocA family oxidoreductase [Kiritimatiellia bacterium]
MKSGSMFAAAGMSAYATAALNGKKELKVAVVGCGGRGTGGMWKPANAQDFYKFGALGNMMQAAAILREQGIDITVKPVAFADYFLNKAEFAAEKFGVDKKFAFGGANGYKKIMAMPEVDVVILTTPLNFRPIHTMAAVKAGKHVFAEKGVAVDAPGVRLMIEASRLAADKALTVVCGTQRRHQRGYLQVKKALDDGLISPILGGEVYWNSRVPWVRERTPEMSNKDYLCNNWLNFTELSGDHICEQHVHNIDVANWYIGRFPKTALAFGARTRRVSGNQYDFFSADLDYGDGVHIHSMCRQVSGCKDDVREFFRSGNAIISTSHRAQVVRSASDNKKIALPGDYPDVNPYVQEHVDLLKSILGAGPYYNEGEACALSTACGIMIRLSAYTGQIVTMNDIIKTESSPFYKYACTPTPEDFEKDGDVLMPEYGENQWPLPGVAWEDPKKKKA